MLRISLLTLTASLVFVAAPARADEREACADASEKAQSLRMHGKLVDARAQLEICSRSVCPKVVRRDCEQWLTEIDAAMPTFVVLATDADGHDITDVKVSVDGKVVTEHLDGRATPIDVGAHVFVFEHADNPPVKEDVLLHEGEKAKQIRVVIGKSRSAPAQATAPVVTAPPKRNERSLIGPIILGSVGVVALGAFGVLDLTGQSSFDDCKDGKSCNTGSLETQRALTWTALGVGVVALAGAAAWLFWPRHEAHD